MYIYVRVNAMSCSVVQRSAMLCCAVQCCAMLLHCIVRYCSGLYSMLCFAMTGCSLVFYSIRV